MIASAWHMPIAFAVDFVLGDPRWMPHPVRAIGMLARSTELVLRQLIPIERLAGLTATALVVGATGVATWYLLRAAYSHSQLAGDVLSIAVLYTALAPRDLVRHSYRVFDALRKNNMQEARNAVGCIVGRDTHSMQQEEITRAAVESVAENTVDGVLSPMLYGMLFGPVGAMVYKAINTLDSMFGYRNERYLRFGWAAARLDDFANLIPARLCSFLVACVAPTVKGTFWEVIKTTWRDAGKHQSPNAGYAEAAFAAALGVQLGGLVMRGGKPELMPRMGNPHKALEPYDIVRASRLMWAVALAALCFGTAMQVAWSR